MNTGIYCIEHKENGKKYIGSSCHLDRRKKEHYALLRRGKHPNKHLQRAWSASGELNFKFEILMTCDERNLLICEQASIDKYKVFDSAFGYNAAPVAGSNRGIKVSAESRKRMADSHIGCTLSEEHKNNISTALIGRPKPPRSKQHIINLRANQGAKLSMEKAREIRELLLRGNNIKEVAKSFGVHRVTINSIRRGVAWRELE